jgi:hypothetical protein
MLGVFYTSIILSLWFSNWQVSYQTFFALNWESAIPLSSGNLRYLLMTIDLDLVIAVVCCNCTISIVVLVITLWTIRFRRQVVAIAECCDRWEDDCTVISNHAPDALAASRVQIQYLRQIYRQQLLTLDRLRALGLFWGVARSLLLKRR